MRTNERWDGRVKRDRRGEKKRERERGAKEKQANEVQKQRKTAKLGRKKENERRERERTVMMMRIKTHKKISTIVFSNHLCIIFCHLFE